MCEHVVEMPGNETWQTLVSQYSVLGFHEGRFAALESQVPGRLCSWLQQSPVGVSLEREIHLLNKRTLTFPVFFGKRVLTHVVILIYFLYLNPKAYQVPVLLAFNISKKKICCLDHVSQTLRYSSFYQCARAKGELKSMSSQRSVVHGLIHGCMIHLLLILFPMGSSAPGILKKMTYTRV